MKIAIIGSYSEDCLEFHLKYTLEKMGNYVEVFGKQSLPWCFNGSRLGFLSDFLSDRFIKCEYFIYTQLAKKIIEYKPDLVLGVSRNISPIVLKILRTGLSKTKIVHLNPDAMLTIGRQRIFAAEYDAYFTKDKYMARIMKNKMGFNVFYLPECFNPDYHKRPLLSKKDAEKNTKIDVMAIGSLYPYRSMFLKRLIDRGLDIKIYGNRAYYPFPELEPYFTGEFVTGAKKSELFYGAKIILNNMHYAEVESVNCKFFEIMGSGGFQICDYNPAVSSLAIINKEIVCFNSIDEAYNVIQYYLEDEKSRHDIAEAGFCRATQEHTYEKRLATMLEIIESL